MKRHEFQQFPKDGRAEADIESRPHPCDQRDAVDGQEGAAGEDRPVREIVASSHQATVSYKSSALPRVSMRNGRTMRMSTTTGYGSASSSKPLRQGHNQRRNGMGEGAPGLMALSSNCANPGRGRRTGAADERDLDRAVEEQPR